MNYPISPPNREGQKPGRLDHRVGCGRPHAGPDRLRRRKRPRQPDNSDRPDHHSVDPHLAHDLDASVRLRQRHRPRCRGPPGTPANYPAAKTDPTVARRRLPDRHHGKPHHRLQDDHDLRGLGCVASESGPSGELRASLRERLFGGETQFIARLQQLGLHADPTPTEIDYVKVSLSPRPQAPLPSGQPRQLKGYQWFIGGIVTVVENNRPIPMLKATATIGAAIQSISSGADGLLDIPCSGPDGQFRIDDSRQLNPPGGVASVEQDQMRTRGCSSEVIAAWLSRSWGPRGAGLAMLLAEEPVPAAARWPRVVSEP